MRLDKYLAHMGAGTRKEVKKVIRDGLVTVGGRKVSDPGIKVEETDEVCLNGRPLRYEQYAYYMLNKPAGVVSATEDPREQTVIDLMREGAGDVSEVTQQREAESVSREQAAKDAQVMLRTGLFPVGRLDKDTEGLLIITNDGALAHRLLSPQKHVDKVYFARLDGPVGAHERALFAAGLRVDDEFTAMPAELRPADPETGELPADADASSGRAGDPNSGSNQVFVTIREGKYHQIKRMFEAVGREVIYLKRISMGPLRLDPALAPGQWRRLTKEELSAIM